ncbi:hypothetical protein M6D93_14330 [Jatrophihabitans telluris]|uniref:YtxH domain-containing protein n=1 Tax=Jatrophihabitans telluris TaxID=2038343 RepID=A0ABY4QV33_9ACTN|nr:hypothetical protein [Jatrophihabitans telluris]UQX87470.1 hypothetical protein M6D93_14330 [Jatrophihabitans telluris]
MKPSFIVGALVGYVLGARAGRERYEDIVAIARRVAGSQTIQSTAGVLQAQAGELAARARDRVLDHIPLLKTQTHAAPSARVPANNGYHGTR